MASISVRSVPGALPLLVWLFVPQLASALKVPSPPREGLGQHIPRFSVNLDMPPLERWKEIALAYKDVLPSLMVELGGRVDELASAGMPMLMWTQHSNIPSEYMAELVGIVKYVAHKEVTLTRLIQWNLYYELGLAYWCSGILTADVNGTVVHGRNLDTQVKFIARGRRMGLQDITMDITYMRRGEPIYTSTGWAGQTGVNTGMTLRGWGQRPCCWSFQQNARRKARDGIMNPTQNLVAALDGGLPFAFAARGLMESDLTFAQAVDKVTSLHLMAPSYFVMAGSNPWEGAVVAMERKATQLEKAALAHVQVLSPSIGRWFIVQTNDDFWTEQEDSRRPEGVSLMSSLGQRGVSAESVLMTMRTGPLFTEQTELTWLGIPATGFHSNWLSRESLEIMGKIPQGAEGSLRQLRQQLRRERGTSPGP